MLKTNWCVITGGPSSGKTTLINFLKEKGHKIAPEAARIIIDQEIAKGRSLEEIRGDKVDFQNKVSGFSVQRELSLSPQEPIFLDRSVLDCLAYAFLNKVNSPELETVYKKYIYSKVFFLQRVVWESDYARSENEETALELDNLLIKTYEEIGYKPIIVPPVPVLERAKFILKNI